MSWTARQRLPAGRKGGAAGVKVIASPQFLLLQVRAGGAVHTAACACKGKWAGNNAVDPSSRQHGNKHMASHMNVHLKGSRSARQPGAEGVQQQAASWVDRQGRGRRDPGGPTSALRSSLSSAARCPMASSFCALVSSPSPPSASLVHPAQRTLLRREQDGLQQQAVGPLHRPRQASHHVGEHLPGVQGHRDELAPRTALQLAGKKHLRSGGGSAAVRV